MNIRIVFRVSLSLPFIHENELARLRIYRKRCWRTKAVKSVMRLGELKGKTTNVTSLTKGGTWETGTSCHFDEMDCTHEIQKVLERLV